MNSSCCISSCCNDFKFHLGPANQHQPRNSNRMSSYKYDRMLKHYFWHKSLPLLVCLLRNLECLCQQCRCKFFVWSAPISASFIRSVLVGCSLRYNPNCIVGTPTSFALDHFCCIDWRIIQGECVSVTMPAATIRCRYYWRRSEWWRDCHKSYDTYSLPISTHLLLRLPFRIPFSDDNRELFWPPSLTIEAPKVLDVGNG